MTKFKVEDVVHFHVDSYLLILALTGFADSSYEGFFVLGENWIKSGGNQKSYEMLHNSWWPKLTKNKKIINYVMKKYLEYQLCEIIEK